MSHLSATQVIILLLNQEDLMSYSKRVGQEDYMSVYMDACQDMEKIKNAFNKLQIAHQNRINTYLFSGLTQVEMAKTLGTKQPNIKRNFFRSLDKLLDLLKK